MEPEGSLTHSQGPPRFPILSQIDTVHTSTFHFLKIRINIIFPSTPGSSKWPLSFRFPHQNSVCNSTLPHTQIHFQTEKCVVFQTIYRATNHVTWQHNIRRHPSFLVQMLATTDLSHTQVLMPCYPKYTYSDTAIFWGGSEKFSDTSVNEWHC